MPAPLLGSAIYMAPESMEFRCGAPSDVWAVGLIVYLFLGVDLPFRLLRFQRKRPNDVKDALVTHTLEFHPSRWGHVSASAQGLISSMLEKDPKMRLSTSCILKHTW